MRQRENPILSRTAPRNPPGGVPRPCRPAAACILALQLSFSLRRENNFIKDFPQLADGLLVIPLPVEEQCRGVLSEPLPDLQLLTGKSPPLWPKSMSPELAVGAERQLFLCRRHQV